MSRARGWGREMDETQAEDQERARDECLIQVSEAEHTQSQCADKSVPSGAAWCRFWNRFRDYLTQRENAHETPQTTDFEIHFKIGSSSEGNQHEMPHISMLMLIKAAVEKTFENPHQQVCWQIPTAYSRSHSSRRDFFFPALWTKSCRQQKPGAAGVIWAIGLVTLCSCVLKSATAPPLYFQAAGLCLSDDGCKTYHRNINHYEAEPSFHERKPPCKSYSKTFLYVFTRTSQCKRSTLSVYFSVALKKQLSGIWNMKHEHPSRILDIRKLRKAAV